MSQVSRPGRPRLGESSNHENVNSEPRRRAEKDAHGSLVIRNPAGHKPLPNACCELIEVFLGMRGDTQALHRDKVEIIKGVLDGCEPTADLVAEARFSRFVHTFPSLVADRLSPKEFRVAQFQDGIGMQRLLLPSRRERRFLAANPAPDLDGLALFTLRFSNEEMGEFLDLAGGEFMNERSAVFIERL